MRLLLADKLESSSDMDELKIVGDIKRKTISDVQQLVPRVIAILISRIRREASDFAPNQKIEASEHGIVRSEIFGVMKHLGLHIFNSCFAVELADVEFSRPIIDEQMS